MEYFHTASQMEGFLYALDDVRLAKMFSLLLNRRDSPRGSGSCRWVHMAKWISRDINIPALRLAFPLRNLMQVRGSSTFRHPTTAL